MRAFDPSFHSGLNVSARKCVFSILRAVMRFLCASDCNLQFVCALVCVSTPGGYHASSVFHPPCLCEGVCPQQHAFKCDI